MALPVSDMQRIIDLKDLPFHSLQERTVTHGPAAHTAPGVAREQFQAQKSAAIAQIQDEALREFAEDVVSTTLMEKRDYSFVLLLMSCMNQKTELASQVLAHFPTYAELDGKIDGKTPLDWAQRRGLVEIADDIRLLKMRRSFFRGAAS